MSHNVPAKPVDAVGSTPGVDVHNHIPNAENEAHPGAQASNVGAYNTDRQGASATNTSSSLTGAGATAPIPAVGSIDVDLKTPRKQDHPAHSAPGGHIHGDPEVHASK